MKSLNFNDIKKHYFTVTLNDKDSTTLMISTPTKGILEDLVKLGEGIAAVKGDTASTSDDLVGDLYEACAALMSRNKTGVKITAKKLGEIFDLEDIMIFFTAYMSFVDELANAKN